MMIDKWLDWNMTNNTAEFLVWTTIVLMIVTEINYIIFLYMEKGHRKKEKESWLNLKFIAIFFAIGECWVIIMIIMAFQYFKITLLVVVILIIIIIWLWLNKVLSESIWGKKSKMSFYNFFFRLQMK